MTGPFSDWPPHIHGSAPTWPQIEAVRDLYRHEAARPTLAAMRAELRHQYEDRWLLELVGERDGQPVTYFSEDIRAAMGAERDAAVARLLRAGHRGEWMWTQAADGWDGKVS